MSGEIRIGIYIRLSMADEDTGRAKTESDSIGNQRMLINRFLDEHPSLAQCPRLEFADDGYTGTNFQRPQFIRMMELVRAGEINLICVKDFSRFSRDYIETGDYLECVFPFLGVRFISINDGYDSDNYKGTTGGLEVVMRSVIYAAYSKDLSVKTTTAKIQMMKQGKYVGGYAPYGYVLHPKIRNKLALDAPAAAVVRRIFDEAAAGRNTSAIAEGLNDEQVPTPGQYFRSRFPGNRKFGGMSDKISWTAAMVYKILTNYAYTGAMVSRRRKSAGLGTKKSIAQDRADWIVVEGMHEAIISSEEFETAQAVIRGGVKRPQRTAHEYPLKGLVRCGNCKRMLTRRKLKASGEFFYTCTYSTRDKNTGCALRERYGEAELERVVYNAIGQMVSLAEKQVPRSSQAGSPQKNIAAGYLSRLRGLQTQAEQLKGSKLRWYERYTAGSISKDEYLKQKAEIDLKLSENTEAVRQIQADMQNCNDKRSGPASRIETMCNDFAKTDHLTAKLAQAFIKAIYVYAPDRIEIEWSCKDAFDSM